MPGPEVSVHCHSWWKQDRAVAGYSSQCLNTLLTALQPKSDLNINTCCWLHWLWVSPHTGTLRQRDALRWREDRPSRNRWHHHPGVLSYVPWGLAELMDLAQRACEISCQLYKCRQVLWKLSKDPSRQKTLQKVPEQISSIWGSTALMAADQSNRSHNFCAVLRVHARPGPVLRNNHLEDVASGVKPTAQCKQDVQETKNYAQKEHCWALPEILCICEWTSIFWHRQPSPCEIKQPREMGTTLLIQHVCIFRDTICTKKVISSAFHRARETVLILSDPFQKKRRVPRIQDYI